ncbi:MAG: hypothetical protein HFG02_01145 [Oscillibacter sp.]|nr:hypothetical protein [Oscillibacter sp.]
MEEPVLARPRTGRSVWPRQHCPAFTLRTVRLGSGTGCWFCRYANFHLREPAALDVGVCCWPKSQSE